MNYQELLDTRGGFIRSYFVRFDMFRYDKITEFARNMEDGIRELYSLGDDLTLNDYDRVYEIMDKIERNAAYYRSMARMGGPDKWVISPQGWLSKNGKDSEEVDIYKGEKLAEIDKGIKEYRYLEF